MMYGYKDRLSPVAEAFKFTRDSVKRIIHTYAKNVLLKDTTWAI